MNIIQAKILDFTVMKGKVVTVTIRDGKGKRRRTLLVEESGALPYFHIGETKTLAIGDNRVFASSFDGESALLIPEDKYYDDLRKELVTIGATLYDWSKP